jgi:hypothetical protein
VAQRAPATPRLPTPRRGPAEPETAGSETAGSGEQSASPAWIPPESAPSPGRQEGTPVTRRQAIARERSTLRHAAPRRMSRLLARVLGLAGVALVLAAGWVIGGPAAALLPAGAVLLMVGGYGLVSGQVRWAHVHSRAAAGAAALTGVALAAAGTALAPLPLSSQPARVERGSVQRPDSTPTATSRVDPDALIATAAPGTALAALGRLPVRAERSLVGYQPSAYRSATSSDGCTVEQLVLRRDLQGMVLRRGSACEVRSGVLTDPYTGRTINYRSGKPARTVRLDTVRLDFVVTPRDAWRTGAASWSDAQRARFAADPLNRIATGGRTGSHQGSSDAASWLPSLSSWRCPHVTRQITVKTRFRLSVTPAERTAMAEVLSSCAPPPVRGIL